MTFTDAQKEKLSAKLDPKHVASRTQAGRSLSYIEGWHAIAEANRIFDFDGWNRETVILNLVNEKPRMIGKAPNTKDGWAVTYTAKVKISVGDVVREGVGAGHGIDADLGLAHESAIKEAETDAMKRALMTFGNPFGLALYDKAQTNVGVDLVPFSGDELLEIQEELRAATIETIEEIKVKARGAWGRMNKEQQKVITNALKKREAELDDIPTDFNGRQVNTQNLTMGG